MTVNRTATAAGKKYERDLTAYLREAKGLDVERLRLTGAEDEGDILLRLSIGQHGAPAHFPGAVHRRFVIEAKREKGFHLGTWLQEAETEAGNYAKHRRLHTPRFVVVHARRNHGIGKSYVTTTLDQWLEQIQ